MHKEKNGTGAIFHLPKHKFTHHHAPKETHNTHISPPNTTFRNYFITFA